MSSSTPFTPSETKKTIVTLPVAATKVYAFPNQQEGRPFSVKAGSMDEAIAANAAYLKQTSKETT